MKVTYSRNVPNSVQKALQLQPATPTQVGTGTAIQFAPGYVEDKPGTGLPPPLTRNAPPQLWITPDSYDQVRAWLGEIAPVHEFSKEFLERRASWFDTAGQNGEFVTGAVLGIAHFKQTLVKLMDTCRQIEASILGPTPRCEGWQDSVTFVNLNKDLQFFATYAPIVDRLITVSQNQRALVADDGVLRYATPITHVALEDFFISMAMVNSEDPLLKDLAPRIMVEMAQHIQLLAQYDQVTFQYKKAQDRLKELAGPLVGVDVPWQGYYPPEYPEMVENNPSTVPDEYLNEQPLQKAFRAAMGGPLEQEYRQVFKVLNHDSATIENQKEEMMADAMWNIDEKKFVSWHGNPWIRLQEITTRRASVVAQMVALAKAAEAYQPKSDKTPEESVRLMEGEIKVSRQLLNEMETIWSGGGIIPSVPENLSRLKQISKQLNRADKAITAAAIALRSGDMLQLSKQFQFAKREYINAVGTPRFKSFVKETESYQSLSFYTQVGVVVTTTVVSAGWAGVVFAGTRGALIGSGASAMVIQGGSLLASGAAFSMSTASLNNLLINEPLPKGVTGWSYEIGSNSLMFGALNNIAMRFGQPLGIWAKGEIANLMGSQSSSRLLGWIPTLGGEVAQMVPTYAAFISTWTPADQIAQQFIDNGTFTPMDTLSKAYSFQSCIRQLGFLAALGVGNKVFASLPLINKLEKSINDYVSKAANNRVQVLVDKSVASRQRIDDLSSRWASDPDAAMREGAGLMLDAAAAVRKELDFLSLFGNGTPGIANRRAELRGIDTAFTDGAQRFRLMTSLTSTLQQAHVHPITPGLVAYDPAAKGAMRGFCSRDQPLFSLREGGDGIFVFTWKGRFDEVHTVTMVPSPTAPISTATDIVPVKAE